MPPMGSRRIREKADLTPAVYAALVDSLFQTPAPMMAGAITAAIAAVMTAFKTGNDWLWLVAALIVVVGAVRAYDMAEYKKRRTQLTEAELKARRRRSIAQSD